MENEGAALIIDNGSGLLKMGLSSGEGPKTCIPTLTGKPKGQVESIGPGAKDIYYGHQAKKKRGILALSYPIKHGYVKNWDQLTQLWKIGINEEIGVESESTPLFVIDPIKSSKFQREKLMKIAFEEFGTPSFFMSNPGVLSLYSNGKTTGFVIDSGSGCTQMIPVMENFSLSHASKRLNFGGRDILETMNGLLDQEGLDHGSLKSYDILRDIKETKCHVAQDIEQELKAFEDGTGESVEYEMPDGQVIQIGATQIKCPEALFTPYLVGCEFEGIHEGVVECVKNCDTTIRRTLYKNIILAGGSTLFKGFGSRLKKEIKGLIPASLEVNVLAPNERKYSAWLGASILSNLSSFSNKWISKADFEEQGTRVLAQKCP